MSSKQPEQSEKTCSRCAVTKRADEFYIGSGGRLRSMCIVCYSAYNSEQRVKHQAARAEYDRSRANGWQRSGRERWQPPEARRWASHLQRTFGVSLDAIEQMFAIQQGRCAICKGRCNRSNSHRLNVDHDHSTGAVRGLLCFQCNIGLGKFKDSASVLRAAADYLDRQ